MVELLPRGLLGIALALALAGCGRGRSAAPVGIAGEPPVMVWAWQRHNDLRFLDPRQDGVVLLVKTLWLGGGESVASEPNLEATQYPRRTWLMACARIEIELGARPRLTDRQAAATADQLAAMARLPGIHAIQVDFDATSSQRAFYRQLLQQLRRRLPPGYPVSITALASSCGRDDWLRGLPVNQAVPMLFRMGVNQNYFRYVAAGGKFTEPLCRDSAGIATDEPLHVGAGPRLYLFAPGGWTEAGFRAILAASGSR